MSYQIDNIQFFVRETQPARFPSALGKAAAQGSKPVHVTSPICHARLTLRDSSGASSWGCAADRLSVRWLDKRPGRDIGLKRRELAALLEEARSLYLQAGPFESPFEHWLGLHKQVIAAGNATNQEGLTSTFASALLERAMLDAVCRLSDRSLFEMLKQDALGIRPGLVHQELRDIEIANLLPDKPVTNIHVRHTVGLFDPLTEEDWPATQRIDDGLPETLLDYIQRQGIRYFKVKVSGDVESDLARLARLWELMPYARAPQITLDANEAFDDPRVFADFVAQLEARLLGLFQHILFIEQPLPRRLTLDPSARRIIQNVSKLKPVIIDEADDSLTACRLATQMGYAGTSHKNCKGIFKSLCNIAWLQSRSEQGQSTLMSAEDLQNLPLVPLQQDLVVVGALGIDHCERNGHHYNFGLSMLSSTDKQQAAARHPDLYEPIGDEWFLKIRQGALDCASLHDASGFGVADEPDWNSMQPMDRWLASRHPA